MDKHTYLIEIMYYDTHNTELLTITTGDVNESMKQFQRNRKSFSHEVLDWKSENDTRQLTDLRDTE
jgi:hypothetical protein|tara:strand:+ start:447 stop:644 length:198 start_codon:yes stop_codon:yes gene_type:complete